MKYFLQPFWWQSKFSLSACIHGISACFDQKGLLIERFKIRLYSQKVSIGHYLRCPFSVFETLSLICLSLMKLDLTVSARRKKVAFTTISMKIHGNENHIVKTRPWIKFSLIRIIIRVEIIERIRLELTNTARNYEKVLGQDENKNHFNHKKTKSVEKIQEGQRTKKIFHRVWCKKEYDFNMDRKQNKNHGSVRIWSDKP